MSAHEDNQDRLRRRLFRRPDRAGGRTRREGRLSTISCFECLAERTIALAQQARDEGPRRAATIRCSRRACEAVLPICAGHRVKIVTNMGAANPAGAAEATREIARKLGLEGLKVAAVTGDDVLDAVTARRIRARRNGEPVAALGDSVVSANAYIGAAPIVEALRRGADVVITGRAADPAMFMAPLVARIRLGDGRLGPCSAGHAGRSSARMRGPGHRRLFRRSRRQGRRRISPGSAFRSARCARTASSSSPRSPARAARDRGDRARSNCSTRSTTPRLSPARRDRRFLGSAESRRSGRTASA